MTDSGPKWTIRTDDVLSNRAWMKYLGINGIDHNNSDNADGRVLGQDPGDFEGNKATE